MIFFFIKGNSEFLAIARENHLDRLTLPSGEKDYASLSVGTYKYTGTDNPKHKRPTVTTHKVVLALFKIQEEIGYDADGRTQTSLTDIVDTLGWTLSSHASTPHG